MNPCVFLMCFSQKREKYILPKLTIQTQLLLHVSPTLTLKEPLHFAECFLLFRMIDRINNCLHKRHLPVGLSNRVPVCPL